jgi:hypothetical protein
MKDEDRPGGVGVSRFGKPTTDVSVGAQIPNQDWCIMSNLGRAVSPFPFTATYDAFSAESGTSRAAMATSLLAVTSATVTMLAW